MGEGDLTEPLVCEGPAPFEMGCGGECPFMELDTAIFLGVEPLEIFAKPFDVVRIPLSSGRMLLLAKRLRFARGRCSGPSTLGPGISVPPTLVVLKPAVNESVLKPSGISGDEWRRRRRRRELRSVGSWSVERPCDGSAGTVGITAARMEGVEVECGVTALVDGYGLLGMGGLLVTDGAV